MTASEYSLSVLTLMRSPDSILKQDWFDLRDACIDSARSKEAPYHSCVSWHLYIADNDSIYCVSLTPSMFPHIPATQTYNLIHKSHLPVLYIQFQVHEQILEENFDDSFYDFN